MLGFRPLLARGGTVPLGTFAKIPAPEVCEMTAQAGFDFVVIDTEHALLSVRDVYNMVVTYSILGVAPLVRITDHTYGDGQRYLDAGAAGLLVPHVSNGAQAAAVMQPFLFPPRGTRGMGYTSRAGAWGAVPGGPSEYIRVGDQNAVRMAMIEEEEAVRDIDAIMAADGVDAIFVGPGDLSLSLGCSMQSDEVQDTVTTAVERAVGANVPVGTLVADAEQARLRSAQGCSFLLMGNDATMFARAAQETVASFRAATAS